MSKNKTFNFLFLFCILLLFPTINTMLLNFIKTCSATPIDVNPGESIQKAINDAQPGDTIFVHAGIYYEHIEINKTIQLIGENPVNTILDGKGTIIPIVRILAPNVTFYNFTVRNTASDWETYGISVTKAHNVSIINNIIKETYLGILLDNSSYCTVLNNTILKNFAYGNALRSNASNNLFAGNNIMENPTGTYLTDASCQNNTFYHNNFINNQNQVINYGKYNLWNDEYPSGGNYWSDYKGVDYYSGPYQNKTGSDGIGDTPYTESFGVNDTYPLMNSWGPITPIADFTYSPEKPVKNETITFDASASYDPDGNITGYKWNFGDGNITIVTTETIMHYYLDYGIYSVTLTVTDNSNLTDTITKMITVQKRISTLSIAISPSNITIGQSVTINGTLYPEKETNITIYYRIQGEINWQILKEVTTNDKGEYSHVWTPTISSAYEIWTSWKGDEETQPANSPIVKLIVNKLSSLITIYANPTAVPIGSNITITGKIIPIQEGVNVTISYQPLFKNWKTLATVKTNPDGSYHHIWVTTEIGTYILKASWPGDEETFGNESYTEFLTINKIVSNITINVEPTTVTVGSNVTINGAITPARANINVSIQFRVVGGTDSWVEIVQTDTDGCYTYTWTTQNNGTYEIKASWQGDAKTLPAESETKTVTVEAEFAQPDVTYYAIAGVLIIAVLAALVYFKIKKR